MLKKNPILGLNAASCSGLLLLLLLLLCYQSSKNSDFRAGQIPKKDRIIVVVMLFWHPSLKWWAIEGQYVFKSLIHCSLMQKQSLYPLKTVDGTGDGNGDGWSVGNGVGVSVGTGVGVRVGTGVGVVDGNGVGEDDGRDVGRGDGMSVGTLVGAGVGCRVG